MRTGIVFVGLLAATVAAAQEHAAQPVANRIDLDSITALVVTFASCAALHAAAAEKLEQAELHGYAATARRRAEVDQLAATCLLAEDRIAKGGTPRDPSAFTAYVEELTALARNRMLAIVSDPDPAAYKKEEAVCSSLTPLEDEILAKISAD
jgi:hypothetical protein